MIPIIYYTIIGINLVVNDRKKVAIGIAILYVISFGLFMKKYFSEDCNEYETFESDLEEVIQYVDKIENKDIYITNKIKSSYMYTLFYTQYDTRGFVDTAEYENKYVEFREVNSFGKYHFQKIGDLKTEENVYVIRKEDRENYDLEDCKVTEFEKYVVIE